MGIEPTGSLNKVSADEGLHGFLLVEAFLAHDRARESGEAFLPPFSLLSKVHAKRNGRTK
jgi:hypothetical protein